MGQFRESAPFRVPEEMMMKKTTKGALAAVAGGTLLFGGAGSLAYWSGTSTVTGSTINSGAITLSAPDCSLDVVAGTHEWLLDNDDPFDPATDTLVPGDTITKVCDIALHMVGSHIGATLAIDTAAFSASNALVTELAPSATFTVDGQPYAPITAAGDYVVQATISVVFDGAAATNGSQSLAAALDDIAVTTTQTHDTAA